MINENVTEIERPILNVGDQIRYQALGGPTLGIVKEILDGVAMVAVDKDCMILIRIRDIQSIMPKFK